MACAEPGLMELESAYLAALGDADTYQVTNNGLVLMGGNVALTFAAEAPPEPMPLVGTGWHVTTIPSGDGAVSSTIAGTEPYMVLADDGSLQGSDGCNTFSGSYEAGEDGTITFGPLATTSMACAPDVMDQATTIGRGLDAAVGFSIEGSTLTLTDGDGAPLLGFSAA
jgi:heat shock protein HslJ